MVDGGKKKELKLVKDETAKWRLEGYQRLDEEIVFYRRYVPITKELNSILIQVYDFSAYLMTTILDAKGYNTSTTASAMQVIPFRDIGNKQAIKDAHQALVELGGSPPPLEQVLGIA
jgi:hypothetical protein